MYKTPISQIECGLHQEQEREGKDSHVEVLFHGSETDLEDPLYSISWDPYSDVVESYFTHLSQGPRRNRSQNHPTELLAEVQTDFTHAWNSR